MQLHAISMARFIFCCITYQSHNSAESDGAMLLGKSMKVVPNSARDLNLRAGEHARNKCCDAYIVASLSLDWGQQDEWLTSQLPE